MQEYAAYSYVFSVVMGTVNLMNGALNDINQITKIKNRSHLFFEKAAVTSFSSFSFLLLLILVIVIEDRRSDSSLIITLSLSRYNTPHLEDSS